jgi:Patatin-like phospholipase
MHRLKMLSELPEKPQFYFNATCLESGRPFVFTRSAVHSVPRPDEPLVDPLDCWISGQKASPGKTDELLPFAVTLEDVGSAPKDFPIAYAVLASAAFPGVFEPLPLRVYSSRSLNGATLSPESRKQIVRLVDGGIYDNTGLTTALTLFDYLQKKSPKRRKLILFSIDANNEYNNSEGTSTALNSPIHASWPFRGILQMFPTIDKVYSKQQSLVDAAIQRKISMDSNSIDFYQIKLNDDVQDQEQISKIPTEFVISSEEDEVIKKAVDYLLHKPRYKQSLVQELVDAILTEPQSPPETPR